MHRRSQSEAPARGGGHLAGSAAAARAKGGLNFNIGDIVEVQDKKGTIRFDGNTDFSHGRWIGIELTQPNGKNDGSVQGKRYFECRENHGMFVRPSQVKVLSSNSTTKPSALPTHRRHMSSTRPDSASLSSSDRANRVAEIRARLSKQAPAPKNPEPASTNTEVPPTPEKEPTPETPEADEANEDSEDKDDSKESTPRNFAPSASFERSDQTVPFRQYEELRIRLRVMEAKRAEDLAKWSNIEKVRTELEQFRVIKSRLTSKLKSLQEECVDLRSQNKDLKKEKDLFVEKQAENEIQIETLIVDREIAEEKIDYLQHHLDTLKEKMEEAAFTADESQIPSEAIEQKASEGYDANAAKEILQLQAQVERLKTALIKYRELSTQTENQLRSQLRQAEEEAATSKHIKKDYHEVKAALAQAQDDIENYKERLMDFESSESMIETLTDQNDTLRDKVDKMTKEIEELEAIKEVNDEIEETYIENNRQMLQEIDHKDVLIRDLQRRVEGQQEAIADHANTVGQYRQLVNSLQDDIQQLQKKTESQLTEAEALQSQSLKMQSLNSSLHSQVIKAQGKTIDIELRKLDAAQASEHLRCIEPYLPESFFKKENDAIRTLLQLKRLVFKANLMGDHLRDQFPIKSINSLIGGEELMPLSDLTLSNYEFRYTLSELSCLANSFIIFLSTCSVSQFLGLSAISHDLISVERKFDGYLEEIRREDFVSSKHLGDLQGLVSSLVHLRESQMDSDATEKPTCSTVSAIDGIRTAVAGSDLINVKLSLIYRALTNPSELNLFPTIPTTEKTTIQQDFLRPLSDNLKEYQKIRTVSKKLLEAIEDQLAKGSLLDSSLRTKITTFTTQHAQLVKFSLEATTKVISHLKEKESNDDPVSFSGLLNAIYHATQSTLNINEVSAFDVSGRVIADLEKLIKEVSSVGPEGYITVTPTPAPWVERSHEFKKEIVVNTATELKLVSLNKDIARLVDEVRLRDQTLGERDLKIELYENRMTSLKEKIAEAEAVRTQLQQAQEQERLYLEAVEKLQAENETLELETIELRQSLSAAPTAIESTGHAAPTHDHQTSAPGHTRSGSGGPGLTTHIGTYDPRHEAMAQRLAGMSDLNFRRKALQISLDLQFDPVLPSPRPFSSGGSGLLASLGLGEKLHQAHHRASALNRDLTAYLASSQIHPASTRLPSLAHDSLLSTYTTQARTLEATWEDARSQIHNLYIPDSLPSATPTVA